MSAVSDIKQELYCADCKNCRLLVWDKSSKLEKMTNRGYIVENEDLEKFYLVRCLWLKDNVIAPEKLEKCEGKQGFKEKANNDNVGNYLDDEPDFGEFSG